MEEKKLTEKESLELITQMIQSTKNNMKVGSGNQFLYWGYFTVALSLFIYIMGHTTHNNSWNWCWMLMFVFWILISIKAKKPIVTTYIDNVIQRVWKIIGSLFIITVAGCIIFLKLNHYTSMILMMPLSLLYVSIGVSITGIIIKEHWATGLPLFSFAIAFYMLESVYIGERPTSWWTLLFGLCFIVMMIIPGHILNSKEKKQC